MNAVAFLIVEKTLNERSRLFWFVEKALHQRCRLFCFVAKTLNERGQRFDLLGDRSMNEVAFLICGENA